MHKIGLQRFREIVGPLGVGVVGLLTSSVPFALLLSPRLRVAV
jgi:hypothetical protein